jgi:formylglycine-generating enzyme required for sulfatase activity
MAIFPVTNGGYRPFLESTGQQIPALVADPSKSEHPVVRVSWYEAISYCQWLNKGTGRKFRLPTEAEWEYAARGPLSLVFPWGKEWDPTRVVFNRSITDATDSVFTHPQGTSVFSNVKQMSGGVWEWVADWYADTYDPEDIRDPKGPKMGTDRVLRGGSWSDDNPDLLRGASRDGGPPEDRYLNVGFRVVED